ncbi:MAG: GNAT family N-acetyltransferase [Crocinitomix sp.]|nr:GNAT family N-acetyltransferase [Crocinitomix sp.]
MTTTFKEIKYKSPDWTKAVKLREKILRAPLGSKFTAKELEEEENHVQIAGFLENELVATAVLVPEGDRMKMQRVVVSENLRSQNIGSHMMVLCEKLAKERNFVTIYCHARDTAVNFYTKNQYQKEAEYFNEDGIPHLKMRKQL